MLSFNTYKKSQSRGTFVLSWGCRVTRHYTHTLCSWIFVC